MIINHHFRVENKAHNFNSSTVNKRFLPPVISISPVTFLSPTSLGQDLSVCCPVAMVKFCFMVFCINDEFVVF